MVQDQSLYLSGSSSCHTNVLRILERLMLADKVEHNVNGVGKAIILNKGQRLHVYWHYIVPWHTQQCCLIQALLSSVRHDHSSSYIKYDLECIHPETSEPEKKNSILLRYFSSSDYAVVRRGYGIGGDSSLGRRYP